MNQKRRMKYYCMITQHMSGPLCMCTVASDSLEILRKSQGPSKTQTHIQIKWLEERDFIGCLLSASRDNKPKNKEHILELAKKSCYHP